MACPKCNGTTWRPAEQLEMARGEPGTTQRRVTRCECFREHQRQLIAKRHRRGRPPKPKPPQERLFPPSFRSERPRGKVLAFKKPKPESYRCSADKEE